MSDVSLACTIGGVSVVLATSVSIQERVNQRSTASFGVIDTTNALSIAQNMKVVLTENGIKKFVGYVDTADRRVIVGQSSMLSLYDVRCKDGHYLSDKDVYTGDELAGVTSGDAVAIIHQEVLATQGVIANYEMVRDFDTGTWSAGTHTNTAGTENGLQLAFAGTTYTKTESTSADWNSYSSTSLVDTSTNDLILQSSQAIKLTGVSNTLAGANLFAYYKIFSFSGRVAATGDNLAYAIWVSGDSSDISGGVDLVCTDRTTLRDAGALDQNQLTAHPNTNLGTLASDHWYYRTISIPAALNGKTLSYASIALEGDKAGVHTIYVRDVYYQNSVFTTLDTIFGPSGLTVPGNKLGSAGYNNLVLSVVKVYEETGYRISVGYTNTLCTILRQSMISWSSFEPEQKKVSSINYPDQIVIETSFDNGYTWQKATNKAAIPNLMPGMSVNGKIFKLRQTLNIGGTNPELVPTLYDCTLRLDPSYVATKSDVVNSSVAGDASMSTGTLVRLFDDTIQGLHILGSTRQWDSGLLSGQTIYSSLLAAPAAQSIYVNTLQLRVSGVGDGKIQFGFAGQYADFTLDIDIQPHTGNGLYGVVYRTTYWGNGNDTYAYYAAINMTGTTSLVLGKGTNNSTGGWTQINAITGGYTVDQWYHMQVVVAGSSHKIYIDGVLVINITDSSYTAAGYVGVRYYNDQASMRQSSFFQDFGIVAGTNLTSTRTWPSQSVSAVGIVESSVIQWNADVPESATLAIDASLDGGATYSPCENNKPIPGCDVGANLAGKSLLLRATFATTNVAQIPGLWGLTYLISSDYQSAGNRISPSLNIASIGYVGSSSFTWDADVPAGATLIGKTSLDGSTYTAVSSSDPVAGITSMPDQVSDDFTSVSSANFTLAFESGGANLALTYTTASSFLTVSGGTKGHARWTLANAVVNGTLTAIVAASTSAGFLLRYSDVSNYYRVVLTSSSTLSSQNATIHRMLSGVLTQIGSVSIDFYPNTYHTMVFSVVGNVVTLSWDGAQVFTSTDATPVAGVGGAGFYSNGGSLVCYQMSVQGNGSLATSTLVSHEFLLTTSDPLVTPVVHTATLAVRGPQLMTGKVLPTTKYRYKKASECIDDAAKQSNMVWKIDEDLEFTMMSRTARPAAWPLWSGMKADGSSDLQAAIAPKLTTQSPTYRNRQYITNAYELVTLTEYKLGNSYDSSWALTYPVESVIALSVNLSGRLFGAQAKTYSLTASSGFDFYIKDTILSQDAAAQLLTDEQVVAITYVGKKPYTAMKEDRVSQKLLASSDRAAHMYVMRPLAATLTNTGYSVVSAVEDGGGCDNTTADALAQARLDQYCILPRDWSFTTKRPGLAIGTLLTSFVPEYGLNDADSLITAITTTYSQHGELSGVTYDVDCTEGPIIGTWSRLFEP